MGDNVMTKPTETDLLNAAVAADPGVPTISEQLANNTTPREQCNCGHAADRHGVFVKGDCTVTTCECLAYESWITPKMELVNMRRIAAENARLYNVAAVALREVREAVERLKDEWVQAEFTAESTGHRRGFSHWVARGQGLAGEELETIIERYDVAIKEAIK